MKLLLRRRWAYHGTFLRYGRHNFILKKLFWWGLILASFFLLSWNSVVKADSFYPSGDILYCEMYLGVGITYQKLPLQGANIGFQYNSRLVRGQASNYWRSHNFFHIATVLGSNPRRYQNRAGAVAVPPRTMVETGLMTYNLTGHTVTLPTGKLFISQPRSTDGDLSRVLQIPNIKTGYGSFKYLGKTRQRRGKYVILSNLGSFVRNAWAKPPAGKVITSWKAIQPIIIINKWVQKGYATNGELVVNLKIELQNQSTYNLSGVDVSAELLGQNVKKIITISANSRATVILEWRLKDYPLILNITKIKIIDPNQHRECVTRGSSNGVTTQGNTRTFIAKRTDVGTPAGWSRYQPDFAPVPAKEFFCVTLLPYTLLESNQTIELLPQMNVSKNSSVNQLKPNQIVKYQLEVTNIGPRLKNVIIRDFLLADFLLAGQVQNISMDGRLITTVNPPYLEWILADLITRDKVIVSFDFLLNDNVVTLPNQLKNQVKIIYKNKVLDIDDKTVLINKNINWGLKIKSQELSCNSIADQYRQKLQVTITNQEKYNLQNVILQINDLSAGSCIIEGHLHSIASNYNWQKGIKTKPFNLVEGNIIYNLDLLVTPKCSGQTMIMKLQMGTYFLKQSIVLPQLNKQMCASNTTLISDNNQVQSDIFTQTLDKVVSKKPAIVVAPLINKIVDFKQVTNNQSPNNMVLLNETNSVFEQKTVQSIEGVLGLAYTGINEKISRLLFFLLGGIFMISSYFIIKYKQN